MDKNGAMLVSKQAGRFSGDEESNVCIDNTATILISALWGSAVLATATGITLVWIAHLCFASAGRSGRKTAPSDTGGSQAGLDD